MSSSNAEKGPASLKIMLRLSRCFFDLLNLQHSAVPNEQGLPPDGGRIPDRVSSQTQASPAHPDHCTPGIYITAVYSNLIGQLRKRARATSIGLQRDFIVAFECGKRETFFKLWNGNVPQETLERDQTCQNLEFNLSVYFAIYPIRTGVNPSHRLSLSHSFFSSLALTVPYYLALKFTLSCQL